LKETALVKQIIQYLNYRGHLVDRTQSGMIRGDYKGKGWAVKLSRPGTADITGCSKDGKFLAIECKINPNKPTALQEAYLEEIRRRGGIAIVAYNLEDVYALDTGTEETVSPKLPKK
jgi:hypothetical protein